VHRTDGGRGFGLRLAMWLALPTAVVGFGMWWAVFSA
jgi:hypothetical protein